MTQPLDINALARETIENLPAWFQLGQWELEELEKAFLFALTNLAAEKQATAKRCADRLSNENEELAADLARHKAALKVATAGLSIFLPSISAKRTLQQIDKLLTE